MRIFHKFILVLILAGCSLASRAQFNLDNIQELKDIYDKWEWTRADSTFYAKLKHVKDSTLKQALLLDWGTYLTEVHDYTWGETALKKAKALAQYNKDIRAEAEANYQLSIIFYYAEIPMQSQQYAQDALDGFIAIKDSLGIGKSYDALGDIHSKISDYYGAMEYFNKAAEIFRIINDMERLSNIYGNMGDLLFFNDYTDSGMHYIQKALDLDREFGFLHNMVSHTSSMAYVYETMGNYEKSYELHMKAHKLAALSDDPLDLGYTNEYLGFYHFESGNLDSAKYYLSKTVEIAKRIGNSQLMTNSAGVLHSIHAEKKQFDSAYQYLYYYSKASDTLFSDTNILGMAELRNKYERAQSESEKELLRQAAELSDIKLQNQQITNSFLWFASIISIIAFGWVYYYATQRRKINHQLRRDKETISAQAARLEEMDHFKSRFFANITHDFKTPLSLIMGYLEILKYDNEEFSETSKMAISHIDESVNRLNDMTEEIRDLIRLQEKKIQLKYVPIHVNAFFSMLADMFKAAAEKKGLALSFKSNVPWDVIIHADKYAVEKIIFNLIENAMKYNTTGKKIEFELNSHEDGIQVGICDDGPGISENKLLLVFERYYQSNEKEQGLIDGQGIGLSVVKEYIELHGGEVSVKSERNVRTCFAFNLPFNLDKELSNEKVVGNLLDEQLRKVLEKRKISLGYHQPNKSRYSELGSITEDDSAMILVVDDDAGSRGYIRTLIEDDFLILEATNGEEAKYILDTTSEVALVIADMMMPKVGGLELIEKIRKHERHGSMPVIAISADSEKESQLKHVMDDNLHFITKPIDPEKLREMIENLIYSPKQV